MGTTRRDFLKGIGYALGAVALTSSCEHASYRTTGHPPIPNGYHFFRIKSSGSSIPGGNTLSGVPGTVMLNDINEVYFYGLDGTNTNGFYELLMDYGGVRPVVSSTRKVVREGDVLSDSNAVSQISMGDVNNEGSFAAVLQTSDKRSGVYLERNKQGFEPVAKFQTPLPGGGGKFGASFGDVDIHTSNDILMVAHYAPSGTIQGQQGVFYLPGGEVNGNGAMVASTSQLIPDINGYVTGIGLVDMHDSGNYVMQAYGVSADNQNQLLHVPQGEDIGIVAGSMLISGSVRNRSSKTLRVVSPALKGAHAEDSSGSLVGEIKYGPRIGANNDAAYIAHVTNSQLVLHYNGHQVISTGSRTPLGATVVSLSAPVVGSDGLLYFQAVTSQGLELIVYNGAELKTILSKGDTVDFAVLTSFFFGFMPEQVDRSGRIVLTGDFQDGSTSIIIGIPI